ncbi:MAG: type II secretion system protein, partial [Caulobacter sp.]
MSRQRLIELLVVMFGVLLALGLENLVEEIRLRGDAQDLEVSFRDEIYSAVQESWLRQAVAPCLSTRLSSLNERVAAARTGD